MKTIYKVLGSVAILICFMTSAKAQSTASAITTAVLVSPISISKTVDMHFGTLAASATSGTVDLDYLNTTLAFGGATVVGGSPTTATFSVAGESGQAISISTPTAVTLTGPGANMTVNGFIVENGNTQTLGATGLTLKVGATLNVNANQVAGTYINTPATATATTGLYVTVNYN